MKLWDFQDLQLFHKNIVIYLENVPVFFIVQTPNFFDNWQSYNISI